MSEIEIKQLLDGDEQFYPQTDLHALVNDGEYAIDDVPTIDSSNLVTSGGVASELALGAVYDVTAHNGGATFESLSALLTDANLANLIPVNIRRGGMSVKFVLTSDNKYVQFRCMAQSFTTDVTQWQGVDDEPIAGSDNLVKSGGVFGVRNKLAYHIYGVNFIENSTYNRNDVVFTAADVNEGDTLIFNLSAGQLVIYVGESIVKYIDTETDYPYTIPTGFTKCTVSRGFVNAVITSISNGSLKDVNKVAENLSIATDKINVEILNNGYPSYLGWTGNKNDVLLTKDDVSINTGDYIRVIVQQGQIVACNSSGTILKYFGVGTTDLASVPSDFAYFKANLNDTILTSIQNQTIISNKALNEKIDKLPAIIAAGRVIGYDTTSLTDLNNAEINKLYFIQPSRFTPSNYHPQTRLYSTAVQEYVLTLFFKYYDNALGGYGIQRVFNSDFKVIWSRTFERNNSGVDTWFSWSSNGRRVIEVGLDDTKYYFTTIKSACEFAFQYSKPHTEDVWYFEKPATFDIIVHAGTYDIIEEMGGVNNWNEEDTFEGYKIGKEMRLFFKPGSKVVCNYTGSNPTIQTYFSPFRNTYGSAEIHGLDIDGRNTRYLIHDEKGGGDDFPAFNVYKSCKFKFIKDSEYVGDITSHSCIGGGLGNKTNVLIEDCYFDGGTECQDTDSVASYHMPVRSSTSDCYVVFRNNYCKTGTFIGQSVVSNTTAEKSKFLISGNSLKHEPIYQIDTNDNIEFMSWNNEIRS